MPYDGPLTRRRSRSPTGCGRPERSPQVVAPDELRAPSPGGDSLSQCASCASEWGARRHACWSSNAGARDGPSTLPLASVRGSDACCRVAPLAGRFIGRSDPDTSHQRGRSLDGASLWCRLGPACESPCVERPARQLRGTCAFDHCCDPAGPVAFRPGRPRPSSADRADVEITIRPAIGSRAWGIAVVAIQLEPAS